MSLKKLIGGLSAIALMSAGPAIAQTAPAAQPAPAAASLSTASSLNGEDGIGWAMGGLVLAAVAYVLISIAIDDGDDEEEPESP